MSDENNENVIGEKEGNYFVGLDDKEKLKGPMLKAFIKFSKKTKGINSRKFPYFVKVHEPGEKPTPGFALCIGKVHNPMIGITMYRVLVPGGDPEYPIFRPVMLEAIQFEAEDSGIDIHEMPGLTEAMKLLERSNKND